jgi:hypothetical protein
MACVRVSNCVCVALDRTSTTARLVPPPVSSTLGTREYVVYASVTHRAADRTSTTARLVVPPPNTIGVWVCDTILFVLSDTTRRSHQHDREIAKGVAAATAGWCCHADVDIAQRRRCVSDDDELGYVRAHSTCRSVKADAVAAFKAMFPQHAHRALLLLPDVR